MFISEMTRKEIKEYIGKSGTLILPVGTCEQHGFHLPLNTDTVCVEYFAKRLAKATGALIAPTLNYGVNLPVDKSFAGTAGITSELLRGQILELLNWWRHQGFSAFVILTYHGDPFHEDALSELGPDVLSVRTYDIQYDDVLTMQDSVEHACEAETSMMMYLCPESVKIECAPEEELELPNHDDYLYHRNKDLPEGYIDRMSGASGYPKMATPEKGKILAERSVTMMISAYVRFCAQK